MLEGQQTVGSLVVTPYPSSSSTEIMRGKKAKLIWFEVLDVQ